MATQPCSLGKRHKWEFVKNVVLTTHGIRTASISQRGLYRCECGARKHGQMDMNIRANDTAEHIGG